MKLKHGVRKKNRMNSQLLICCFAYVYFNGKVHQKKKKWHIMEMET
jgi:hypothetical protein